MKIAVKLWVPGSADNLDLTLRSLINSKNAEFDIYSVSLDKINEQQIKEFGIKDYAQFDCRHYSTVLSVTSGHFITEDLIEKLVSTYDSIKDQPFKKIVPTTNIAGYENSITTPVFTSVKCINLFSKNRSVANAYEAVESSCYDAVSLETSVCMEPSKEYIAASAFAYSYNEEKPYLVGICKNYKDLSHAEESISAFNDMCDVVYIESDSEYLKEVSKNYSRVLVVSDSSRYKISEKAWVFEFSLSDVPEAKLIKNARYLINNASSDTYGYSFKRAIFWKHGYTRIDGIYASYTVNSLHRHVKTLDSKVRNTLFRIKNYSCETKELREEKYNSIKNNPVEVKKILGEYTHYYNQLYYNTSDIKLTNADAYRHIIDETNIRLVKWIEENTLSLCVVAKNEGDYINTLLKSAEDIVDEIVVVIDSRSSDSTEDIARKYTDKVYKYTWSDDTGFSGIKNFAKNKATGAWILMLDADEEIPASAKKTIIDSIQYTDVTAYLCTIKNFLEDPRVKDNPQWELSETFRLYRNIPGLYYSGIVHEDISNAIAELKEEKILVDTLKSAFNHYGYLKPKEVVEAKHAFYEQLLNKQIALKPNDVSTIVYLATHYNSRKEYDKAIELYEKAIDICPTYWKAYNDLGTIYFKMSVDKAILGKAQRYFQLASATIKTEPMRNEKNVDKVLGNLNTVIDIGNSI